MDFVCKMINKKVAVVFGTRPEAIKMVPVIMELSRRSQIECITISTGQHKQMLNQILQRFNITVDFEMNLMEPNQTLFKLSSKAMTAFEQVLSEINPDLLLVQGDTTTAFLGALSAFYKKIPVGHVEAGLRTSDKYFPFPEEVNRRLITVVSDLNFAPTKNNKENLIKEGISASSISVTGNTGIDTLLMTAKLEIPFPVTSLENDKRMLVVITVHRRESFGSTIEGMLNAVRKLAESRSDCVFVYPVHLNPNVREPVSRILSGLDNVYLIDPMDYFGFVKLMQKAFLILTDSGGIQEEAPTLGIPVLVLRNETERPEAVDAGTVLLVGTDPEMIISETIRVLDDERVREKLRNAHNPYGDGYAAQRIVDEIVKYFKI